jgi:hypothetical protein
MPYARPYRTTSRMRRNRYRSRAASSIQAAWRARKRRKKGSVVARTALANRRAIKRIKKNVELKFVNSAAASSRTNFCGQILSRIPLDNYGMSQSSAQWVAAGGAATTLPSAASYCPVMLNPCLVVQAGQTDPSAPTGTLASTENARLGNDITMSHVTFKITMVGGCAQLNAGAYENVVRKQKVTALLILDREPAKMNPTLITNAPTYGADYQSCQLYPRTPDNPSVIAGLGSSTEHRFAQIRSLPLPSANPPGVNTADSGSKDLFAQSFYSKDSVIGKTGRFKILKKVSLSCYQQTKALTNVENLVGSSVRTNASKSMTHKGKYKFHFSTNTQVIPDNQTLLLCLWSDTPTNRSAGGSVPLNYCDPPLVSVVSRFSFRDP